MEIGLMKDEMDTAFDEMLALLNAVWPEVREIDWSEYCTKNHLPEPGAAPWYTGLTIMCRCNIRSWYYHNTLGLPASSKENLRILKSKIAAVQGNPGVTSSLTVRDPANDIWAGARQDEYMPNITWAVTGLPDVADHLLIGSMMVRCDRMSTGRLYAEDWHLDPDPDLVTACEYLGMSTLQHNKLRERVLEIVKNCT